MYNTNDAIHPAGGGGIVVEIKKNDSQSGQRLQLSDGRTEDIRFTLLPVNAATPQTGTSQTECVFIPPTTFNKQLLLIYESFIQQTTANIMRLSC